jgi:hypothetical protein
MLDAPGSLDPSVVDDVKRRVATAVWPDDVASIVRASGMGPEIAGHMDAKLTAIASAAGGLAAEFGRRVAWGEPATISECRERFLARGVSIDPFNLGFALYVAADADVESVAPAP